MTGDANQLDRGRLQSPDLRASERPLRAFVSSVMRPDLTEARNAVVTTLDGVPFLSAWAFEFTPASSESADGAYLRHVREADFVIWIASAATTAPVQSEIREALAAERSLIVVRFGDEGRSPETEALLAEVGLRAKYADATNANDLGALLSLTMGDEIVRALRAEPKLGRLARIQTLGQASLGRSLGRWQASGLPRAEAYALAIDSSRGAGQSTALPTADEPVALLCAEMGAGKSQIAERYFQAGIQGLLRNGGDPIPVWLSAADAAPSLRESTVALSFGLGDPLIQGARIVIDGLDEVGVTAAMRLIGQARELTGSWPTTTVLLTSRPLGTLTEVQEVRTLPELDDDSVAEIVEIGAARPIAALLVSTWDEPVRETVRRPLFALLYGLSLRSESTAEKRSKGDLLAFLGEHARRQAGGEADDLLRRLAADSVARGLAPVPASQIADYTRVDALIDTGIVVSHSNRQLSLGLPAIAQWFAAQAILMGEVAIEDLLESASDIDMWRYPLAILVATASFKDASTVLLPLMEKMPGLAFWVVDEALVTSVGHNVAPPAWKESGTAMRLALEAMGSSLGELAEQALPFFSDGSVHPLGVDVSGGALKYAFAPESYNSTAIFHLGGPLDVARTVSDEHVRTIEIPSGAAWPWLWARDLVRDAVGQLFARYALPHTEGGTVSRELAWRIATEVANAPAFLPLGIDTAPILDRLRQFQRASPSKEIVLGGTVLSVERAVQIVTSEGGAGQIAPPHPGPDLVPGPGRSVVPQLFTDDRMLERMRSTHELALEAYMEVVDLLFSRLAPRLALMCTLPAVYWGRIDPDVPVVSGFFEALERSESSRVEFRVDRSREEDPDFNRVGDALNRFRPETREWITAWHTSALVHLGWPTPATELAYDWIWRDLAHIRLVEGPRPNSEPFH